VQTATAQSKAGTFLDYGVAEAPTGFQAGRSDCMYFFSFFLFILFAHLEFMQPKKFVTLRRLNHEHFEILNLHAFFYA
jgi:hypothetical protein